MTYNVFGGTLNPTQSIPLIRREVSLLVITIKSGVYCAQFYSSYYSFHIWGATYTRELISVAIFLVVTDDARVRCCCGWSEMSHLHILH